MNKPGQRQVRTVAVIGAGPAGLVAAKEALAGGFSVVAFEQRQTVGGTWIYNPEPMDEDGLETSAMYRCVTANASRPFMEFSDFPLQDSVPVYPRHAHIAEYLRTYAATFGVIDIIRFGHRVLSVTPTAAGSANWRVRWQHHGIESEAVFDAVAIANGHHSVPRWPKEIPGLDTFGGPVLHSHAYKTPSKPVEMLGRRVLVVGIGNSACDLATDLASQGVRVFLSTRSGGWVFPRWLTGRPVDQVDFETRFGRFAIPDWLSHLWEPLSIRRIRRRYFGLDAGVTRWGLMPRFGPYQAHAAVNDELFSYIGNGMVVLKGELSGLFPGAANFVDGACEKVDVVIFATGYSISFPFLAENLVRVDRETNRVELYQQMLSPDLPETLAFLGVVQPQTGFMPVIEMQARWVVALWQRRIALPSPDNMRESIAADRRERERVYVDRPRHSIEVEWPDYTDRLATQLGVMPKPLRHPGVLRSLLFEPVHGAHYRLDGVGANPVVAESTLLRLARNRRSECFNKGGFD